MSVEIEFAGLEAPGCKSEVGRHSTRSIEARRIIDSGLESQRGDEADARRRHQALADRVGVCSLAGAIIEFAEGAVEHQPCVEHRQE